MKERQELQSYKCEDVIYKSKQKNAIVYMKQVDGHLYAIKRVKLNYQCQKPNQELQVCNKIKHNPSENLIQIFDCWEGEGEYYIMMQHYPYTLQQYLAENSKEIAANPQLALSIFIQICHGIFSLRKLLHVHRDLKCSNILVRKDNDCQLKIVLVDFAECNQGEYLNDSKVGTNFFMAPEIKAIGSVKYYDNRVDIWSLGIILFQIFAVFQQKSTTNKIPQLPELNKYLEKCMLTQKQLKQFSKMMQQFKPIVNKKVPKLIRNLMHEILEVEPQKRLSLEEICTYLNDNKQVVLSYFQAAHQNHMSQKLLLLSKASQVHPCFMEIEKMRSLYHKFYLPLSKINLESNRYTRFYLFLYNGLVAVSRLYQKNKKQMKEEILIKHVFGGKFCMQSMVHSELILKNALNSKYSDPQLATQFESRTALLDNPNLKKFLLSHFNTAELESLFAAYREI